ncbi:MAG: methyltransferase domain-containing protein [Burkholderiales bacterium]
MGSMNYDADLGRIQRTLACSKDIALRRTAVHSALDLRSGEQVLEIGCGGGLYACDAGHRVGPTGRVCAVDASRDQIAAAKEQCANMQWVECAVGNALALPYEDGTFNAAFGVQVIEYLPELDTVLRELHRVLHTGGRLLIFATNWTSVVWHSTQPDRMQRMLREWNEHAPFPDLPAILPASLKRAGFAELRQTPVPVLNTSYDVTSFSYWIARLMKAFLAGRGSMRGEEIESWFAEFDELQSRGEYFYCSTPVITQAVKLK